MMTTKKGKELVNKSRRCKLNEKGGMTMTLEAILAIISTSGLALVIVGLVILRVIDRAKKNDAIADKYSEADVVQSEEQTKQGNRWQELGYSTVRRAIDDTGVDAALHKEEQEKVTAKFDMAKHVIMTNALKKSTAKRVLYFAYHNGGDDYQMNPFKRMSCETEVMTEDVPPIQNKYRDLFRTFMYTVYAALSKDDHVSISNMDEIKETDPSLYVTMTQDAIKAFFACPIKNERGNTFAFVAYCYSEPQKEHESIDTLVLNTANRLEGLYFGKERDKQTTDAKVKSGKR